MNARPLNRRTARAVVTALVALAVPGVASAHGGPSPTPDGLWRAAPDPVPFLALLAFALAYAIGLQQLWRRAGRGHGVGAAQVLAFGAGMLALAVALVSPLDALSNALFSAHMVQHLLLLAVAPPLLVLGLPPVVLFWALPGSSRRRLGRWWLRSRVVRHAWRTVSQPVAVLLLASLGMWTWHLPPLFDAALRNDALHLLEHTTFVLTALLFWWTVLQPRGRRRLSHVAGLLFLVTMLLESSLLGALLTFANAPWYTPSRVVTAWGLTPLQDQQVAGLLMWVPGGAIYIAAVGVLLAQWMRDVERAARDHEAAVEQRPYPRPG